MVNTTKSSSPFPVDSPAVAFLQTAGVPFRLFHHSSEIHSLEEAAGQRGQTPDQVIRSLLFRLPDHSFVMILASGPSQIDWRSLRQFLGYSRMTLATSDEVFNVTGCKPGTVSPFGLPDDVPILVDQDILKLTEVSFGSCKRGTAIIITVDNLMHGLNFPKTIPLVKK